MAKRKKNGGKQNVDPVRLARRFFDRNDYRQALKHARVASRKSPGDETRQLLEQVSLARADELLSAGHLEQARDLLVPLAKKTSDSKLKIQLPELLLRAGVLNQFPGFDATVSDGDREKFETDSFDQAVVDPDKARSDPVLDLASKIRSSLLAVEAGDDDRAIELLRGIPRNSPAADWRYFVRGLMAWYGDQGDDVDANWNRLDPHRAASRVVAQLTSGGAESGSFGVRTGAVLPTSVIKAIPEMRAVDRLQQILLELANEDWDTISDALVESRLVMRKQAPQLLERMSAKIVSRLVAVGDIHSFDKFCRKVDPPAGDPNWNRARATLTEDLFLDNEVLFEDAENEWLQCLGDIDHLVQFSKAEKQIARTLIKVRVGQMAIAEIDGLNECTCGRSHEDEIAEMQIRAAGYLEQAIKHCPECIDAWHGLIDLYKTVGDTTALSLTRRRMLVEFPDDLDVLVHAAAAELKAGDPLANRDYLLRAIGIDPLDERLRAKVMLAHRECARMFIRGAEFELARAELDASVAIDNGNILYQVNHQVLRAILELSAENDFVAEGLVKDALEVYDEPTAAYLDLAIEASKVDLPPNEIQRFEQAWRSESKKKCHSQTAAQISKLLSPLADGVFPDTELYGAEVLTYVKRSRRVRFNPLDLRSVCVFLQIFHELPLAAKFAQKGRKLFPEDPFFHLLVGEYEMAKGPFDCRRKFARNAFTHVLTICDQSTDASYIRMAESSRKSLSFLNEMGMKKPPKPRFSKRSFDAADSPIPEEIYEVVRAVAEKSGMDEEEVFKIFEEQVAKQDG